MGALVVTSLMIGAVSSIYICTDNLNIAQQARTISNGSSQDGLRKFKQIAAYRKENLSLVGFGSYGHKKQQY